MYVCIYDAYMYARPHEADETFILRVRPPRTVAAQMRMKSTMIGGASRDRPASSGEPPKPRWTECTRERNGFSSSSSGDMPRMQLPQMRKAHAESAPWCRRASSQDPTSKGQG